MTIEKTPENRIFTVPNGMTVFRLLLIPLIVWAYWVRKNNAVTVWLLAVSGLTDVFDGMIARKTGQITNLGKILDPIADKLTQGITMICLLSKFPAMWVPFGWMVLKEVSSGIAVLLCIRKTKRVSGSRWHGKLATVMLYGMFFVHLIWRDIPKEASHVLILTTTLTMVLSFILYLIQNVGTLRNPASEKKIPNES